MTLGELIAALEAADPAKVVPYGFDRPHSYRGYYTDLAFEPARNVTVAAMLADARSAVGATYQGWKGGDYVMGLSTDCWLSDEGTASGDTMGPLLLRLLLDAEVTEDEPAAPATMAEPTPADELRQAAATVREHANQAEEISPEAVELFALLLEDVADRWPRYEAHTSTAQAAHVRKQSLAFARQINTKREGK